MKICLFNPLAISTYPPLNLTYLASYLKKQGRNKYELRLVDINCSPNPIQEILDFNPDVVGFTSLSSHIIEICEMSILIRNLKKDILLVCGGAHATVLPQDLLLKGKFDIVVMGEGEETFRELVDTYFANDKKLTPELLKNIKGIAFKEEDDIKINTPRELIDNLDSLPHPDRDLLNNPYYHNRYYIMRGMNTYGVSTIAGSRGCPFNCIFCCVNFTTFNRVRFHSVSYVADEMDELAYKYKSKWLFFTDDTFLVNKKIINDLCEEIILRGLNKKLKWECQVRSNLVSWDNLPLLKLMKKAGCVQIDYGFESGNQRVLTLIKGKGITIEDNQRAIDLTNKAGIKVLGTFILGTPTENYAELADTKKFILRNYKKMYRFQVTCMIPYPGTKVYELSVERGLIGNDYYEQMQKEKNENIEHGLRVFCDSIPTVEILKLRNELDNFSFKRISLGDKIGWLIFNLTHNKQALLNGMKWIVNRLSTKNK